MKIKYLDDRFDKAVSLVLVEMAPAVRTITHIMGDDDLSSHRISFPYTYFLVQATGFGMDGCRFHSLKFYVSSTPVTSPNQHLYKMFLPPMSYDNTFCGIYVEPQLKFEDLWKGAINNFWNSSFSYVYGLNDADFEEGLKVVKKWAKTSRNPNYWKTFDFPCQQTAKEIIGLTFDRDNWTI